MRRTFVNLAICVVTLLISLAAVELIVRALLKDSPSPLHDDRPRFYFFPKDSKTTQDWSYSEKDPDVFRIAVLGDSFSFAPDMQFDDAFPKRLERYLNLNTDQNSPLRVEVLNMGVPGTGSRHQAEVVRRLPAGSIDLIISQITLNDPQLRPLSQEPEAIRRRFGRYQTDNRNSLLRHWKSLRFALERLHNWRSVSAYIEYHYRLFDEPETWNNFASAYEEMKASSMSHGVPLVAVIFPLFDFPLGENYPFTRIHQKIKRHLRSLEIPFLDLKSAYEHLRPDRLQIKPGVDSHPNEIAHRIATERILMWLHRSGFLPPESFPSRVTRQRDNLQEVQAKIKFRKR